MDIRQKMKKSNAGPIKSLNECASVYRANYHLISFHFQQKHHLSILLFPAIPQCSYPLTDYDQRYYAGRFFRR